MTSSQALVQRMIERFPQLQPLLDEHLHDMGGELLPYLLLADVARWANTQVGVSPEAVTALTSWLEAEFAAADDEGQDLIGLGFVEAIPSAPEGALLLHRLGPRLGQVASDLGLT